jgi:hypothetical protein
MNIMNIKEISNETVLWLYFIMFNISTGDSCHSICTLLTECFIFRQLSYMACF